MADYKQFKDKVFSAMRGLAKEFPPFEDAEMLVGGSEATASLRQQDIYKSIDTEWIDAIEKALPALDVIIRKPSVAIEDVDEILPIELSRHITDKSIKHLAQHTNLITSMKENGDVVPQKILNVYHDETMLTYENKFVNTLLARLSAFVDKRYRALLGGSGVERNYKFDYQTQFEHLFLDDGGKNLARIHLNIELTSPLDDESESNWEIKDKYAQASKRVQRINMALAAYLSSPFAKALGRNYIRPPVIRTNAILKNKDLKECLTLWEYIESFDKVGYTVRTDAEKEMPSSDYIGDLYSTVALQYTNFYYGVVGDEDVRLLSKKQLSDVEPQFDADVLEEELNDYLVYDSEYKKTVPVSRLMNNRKKLSEDEKRIYRALLVALKADEILNAEMKAAEKEMRRLAMQRRKEEEERRRAEEAERARIMELLAMSPVEVRYRRSFLSRYIQSGDLLQGYYGCLKNKLLSLSGIKSRVSWKADSFYKGRTCLAKLDVRGKRLNLYLALEPDALEGTKYRFTDVSEKKNMPPVLVKVKGKLSFMHAMQLIDLLAAKYMLTKVERADKDYQMPYEGNDALIQKGLIKVVFPKGVVFEDGMELTKEDLSKFFKGLSKGEEKTEEEVAEHDRVVELLSRPPVEVRYRRSFLSRYIQSGDLLQGYYGSLKNKLLSLSGVKSRISWKGDSFFKGRICIAKMDVRGKRLDMYLSLEPSALEGTKYRFTDVSEKKNLPVFIKIKGRLGFMHAMQLVDRLASQYGLTQEEWVDENYQMPYEDNEALIQKGLIKRVLPKGIVFEKDMELTNENLSEFFRGLRKDAEEK